MAKQIIPAERIEQTILEFQGQKVIIDADLASIYGTTTKRLNEQVRRNISRFLQDFEFQLTDKEKSDVVANFDHLANLKFSPHLPLAFTEHGALMAASVLNTERAVQVSVFVVRAFVKIRELVATHKQLAIKLSELEQKVGAHDRAIMDLVQTIRRLMESPPSETRRRIGF